MGEYVNPPDTTKERFLTENGRRIAGPTDVGTDELPVCLVDSGPFTAAAIAYNEREVLEFTDPADRRPRLWFAVSRQLLRPFMSAHALRTLGDG